MARFGLWTVIDNLAGGDVTRWEKVLNMQNSDLLLKYAMQGQQALIEAEMERIQKSKYKNG
jgi:hypothetical protein